MLMCIVERKTGCKRKVSGPVMHIKRALTIIGSCVQLQQVHPFHKQCSERSMLKVVRTFTYTHCNVDGSGIDGLSTYMHLDIGNGVSVEKIREILLFRRYVA